jgi:hypothetical protein
MGEKSNLEQQVETYLHIIDASGSHNERFESQSASKYKEYCSKPVGDFRNPKDGKIKWDPHGDIFNGSNATSKHVYSESKQGELEEQIIVVPPVPAYDMEKSYDYNDNDKNTFNLVCSQKNLGGVWWYTGGKNLGTCGCVNNPTNTFKLNGSTINMSNIVEYSAVENDIRSLWERTSDWTSKCIGDWHCVADIASIAVLFIPVPGLNVALSAAIDGISAAGYVIEGDEGWELNAGLTLVGSLFSGLEAMKFTNKALKGGLKNVKWTNTLGKVTTELNDEAFKSTLKNMTKSEAKEIWTKKVRDLTSGLSSTEIKQLTDALEAFQKLPDIVVKDLEKIMKNMVNLTPKEKEILQQLTKGGVKESKLTKFANDVKNANFDIKKVLSKYIPKFSNKEALIQATLFGLIQGYGEEFGEALSKGIDALKEFTGYDIDNKLTSKIDTNKKDDSSLAIKQQIEDLASYYLLSHMIDIETRIGVGNLLSKYDIKVEKDVRDIVFNGMESIIGKVILEKTDKWLRSITDTATKMEKEGKPTEEIKTFIITQYEEILELLENAPERDKLKELEKNLEIENNKNKEFSDADKENAKQKWNIIL